ncbi:hypothetical protein NDU88_002533 [Pleurodeles waltl]|uniref:Uncharacterized protein n=1 Tax=Pleurodeles waltl TaxID=8319 RepID=A0AAV7LCS1_PLEWA|nr:hypothetical protein NDU88_002533 [Pleurodeles waltl]
MNTRVLRLWAIARAAVLRSRREAGNLAAKTFGPRRHAGVDEVAAFRQNFHTKLLTDLRLGLVPLVSPHVGRQLRAIARAAVLRSRREVGNLAAKTFGPRRHAGVDEVAAFRQNFHTKLLTDLRLGLVPLVSPYVGRQLRAIARAAVLRSRREAGNLAAKTFGPRRHAGVDEVAAFRQNFHTKLLTDLRLGLVPLVSPHVGRQLRYWVFQNRY